MRLRSILIILLCSMLMVSCGAQPAPEPLPDPEPAPSPIGGTESVIGNIPEGSILLFQDDEGAAKLIADMEAGRVPSECRAMYDEMGARPEVVMTDPELITEAYNRLGHMTIGGETMESITDCYHYIVFTLQDGTNVGWSFESAGMLCRGQTNYEVTHAGTIWEMVRAMQDAQS